MNDLSECVNVKKVGEVLVEVQRRKESRRDFLFGSPHLSVKGRRLVLGSAPNFRVGDRTYFDWKEAEAAADQEQVSVVVGEGPGDLPFNRTAERQLAARTGVPLRFLDDLYEKNHGDLADHNLTTLLARSTDRILIRTLDGQVRAVLSDSYRLLDNHDVFFAAADEFQKLGAVVWSARLWDDGFELLAVSPDVHGEVVRQFDAAGGDYHHAVFEKGGPDYGRPDVNAQGDVHNALVKVRNSETGCGGLSCWLGTLRRACNNTMILGKAMTVVHLGRRHEGSDGVLYSDETREAEDKTVWLKLRDTLRTAFDRDKFRVYMDRMNKIAAEKLPKPEKAVDAVVKEYELTVERRDQLLGYLFGGRDLTRYGLVNACTRAAQDVDDEEASRLEEVGGKVAEMADGAFAQLVAA